MQEIHPNLPPIHFSFLTIFDGIILGVFGLGILFFIWKFFFKKEILKEDRSSPVPTKKIFIPPVFSFEEEILKLKQLKKEENWKKFSLYATKILKKILEHKFKIPLDFATGKEIEEILQKTKTQKHFNTIKSDKIHEFFTLTDPIKFAKAEGKDEMAEKILKILKTYQ